MIKLAVVNPGVADGLARTFIDGLIQLAEAKEVEFRIASSFDYPLPLERWLLPEAEFLEYAGEADLVILIWGKREMRLELAEAINSWDKTIYLDGSEPGKNRRYNGPGKIDERMLEKCALYFRREKPYAEGIIPLTFGIESAYTKHFDPNDSKDIDFFCVFGQEEYPVLRREVREALERFSKKNGFSCFTKKTRTRDGFYKALSRAKVGVSVGGGGFDTFRFWEILANNCILLTEKIDISWPIQYKRVHEFSDLGSFNGLLEEIGKFLKNGYNYQDMEPEYKAILEDNSTVSRVRAVLNATQSKGLI